MAALMVGIEGERLASHDRRRLSSPPVGGAIIMARNYSDYSQLQDLTAQIHAINPELIIAVDQEGGRIQRLQKGFTRLPAMRTIGKVCDQDLRMARQYAHDCGTVIATELKAVGIDLSFAPVLDLDRGSEVIGDRAFSSAPATVTALAACLIVGLRAGGAIAVGKHFPGHGSVAADTHVETAYDERSLDAIMRSDMRPFTDLMATGQLDAVMLSHVVYKAVDAQPAALSPLWLGDILRRRLGFRGFVFSDDLGMVGSANPDLHQIGAAMRAGCDMILTVNDYDMADRIISSFDGAEATAQRAAALRRWQTIRSKVSQASAAASAYEAAVARLSALNNTTL